MNSKNQISVTQLAAVLLVSRLSPAMAFAPGRMQQSHGTDFLLSILLNEVGLVLLFLPTWWFDRRTNASGTLDYAYLLFGKGGGVFAAVYGLFALYVIWVNVLQFLHFVSASLSPEMPVTILTIVIVAACFWAAFYGIEAFGRGGTILAVVVLASLGLTLISLLPEFDLKNFPPLLYDGVSPVLSGAAEQIPRTVEMGIFGLLLPYVKGSTAKSFFVWDGVLCAALLVIQVSVIGVLGDFGDMVVFPYHTVVQAAKTAVLERLDMLLTAVWVAALFVKMSLFALAFVECAGRLCGNRSRPYAAIVGAAVTLGAGLWAGSRTHLLDSGVLTAVTTGGLLITAVAVPLVLVLWDMLRKKRVAS